MATCAPVQWQFTVQRSTGDRSQDPRPSPKSRSSKEASGVLVLVQRQTSREHPAQRVDGVEEGGGTKDDEWMCAPRWWKEEVDVHAGTHGLTPLNLNIHRHLSPKTDHSPLVPSIRHPSSKSVFNKPPSITASQAIREGPPSTSTAGIDV